MTGEEIPELEFEQSMEPLGGDWLRPELKERTGSKIVNRCVVFNEMGDQEFAAIERQFPRVWELFVQRGVTTNGAPAARNT